MIEDEGFTTWICTFTLVTLFSQRPTVQSSSRQKCEVTFKDEKMAINIKNSKLVLNIDLGTSVATEAYVGFSCHYIADDWDMQSTGPTTMPLQDRRKNPGSSSLRCISHTLQLMINTVLKHPSIEKATRAARCLIEHLRKNELASTKLRETTTNGHA